MRKKIFIIIGLLALNFVLGACGKKEKPARTDIDFTICDKTKMPQELVEIIEEKKTKEFKLSYLNNDYMYIVIGYGEKNRQNLSVVVDDLYMTDNAIYVETNLKTEEGKEADDVAGDASMYPYIVIKCEKYDLPVVFDID